MSSLVAGSYHIVSVDAPTLVVTYVAPDSSVKIKTQTNNANPAQIWDVIIENGKYFIRAHNQVQFAAVEASNIVGTDIKTLSKPEAWVIKDFTLAGGKIAYVIHAASYNNVWGFIGNADGTVVKLQYEDPRLENQKWRFVHS